MEFVDDLHWEVSLPPDDDIAHLLEEVSAAQTVCCQSESTGDPAAFVLRPTVGTECRRPT